MVWRCCICSSFRPCGQDARLSERPVRRPVALAADPHCLGARTRLLDESLRLQPGDRVEDRAVAHPEERGGAVLALVVVAARLVEAEDAGVDHEVDALQPQLLAHEVPDRDE